MAVHIHKLSLLPPRKSLPASLPNRSYFYALDLEYEQQFYPIMMPVKSFL